MKFFGIFLATLVIATTVSAQPRPVAASGPADASKAVPPPAPQTMKAKYEGGIFGYNNAMDGTLTFDDTNKRLLFKRQQKELFFIPYNAVNSAFADTQKRQPKAATVAQHVPYFGWPLGFIKTKNRYLTLQYSDPDTHVAGITSFRLENMAVVESVVYTLANKAGLEPRGGIYIRKREDVEAKTITP